METKCFIYLIVVSVLAVSCAWQTPIPTGTESLEKIVELAERVHLTGDYQLLLEHTDMSGIPPGNLDEILSAIQEWKGIDPGSLDRMEIQSHEEYEPYELMPSNLPAEMKAMFTPMEWNIQPDKYIVFYGKPMEDGSAVSRKTYGVFSTDGQWFFATGYKKKL